MATLSDTAVQLEARRRVSEETAAARAAALEAQKRREADKLRLIEAQREDRIRRDAEQIQARLRAEEAEREVRRVAEQEAFEQAVAEQVAALKKRPLEERVLAEVEELRLCVSSLSAQLSSTLQSPPASYGLETLQTKIASLSSSPWNSGIDQMKAQLQQISSQISSQASTFNSQIAEIKAMVMKPARPVGVFASATALACNAGSPSGARTLHVKYHLVAQGATLASGPVHTLDVLENQLGTISVPAGQRLSIYSAQWKPHNNVLGGVVLFDSTTHLRSLGLESQ
jgi:hypothetical protein